MSIAQTTLETYHPGEPWKPHDVPPQLTELADEFHFLDADEELEHDLAKALSRVSNQLIQGDDKKKPEISRAENALALNGGNCIAHTEIGAGIARSLDLDIFPLIGREIPYGWHASSLWLGKTAVWEIDYYFEESGQLGRYIDDRADIQARTREALEAQKGIHLYFDLIQGTMESVPAIVEGELEGNPYAAASELRQGRTITALPYEAGINMLKAFADYQRYLKLKRERIAQVGDQVLSFVPHGIA